MYQIANEAQDFQYKREVCPSEWVENMAIEEIPRENNNLNIRWPEIISNEDLWERTQQCRIEESIERRKWKWIGRTLRNPENNITRSALELNPQGSRRRGRPKQFWRRSVKDELAKKQITWGEAKRIASNRVRWRFMVDALCCLLGAKMA